MTSFNLALLRNELAFFKYRWYLSPCNLKQNYFDMSIVGTLKSGFRPVAQAGAAVALAVSPMMAPASYAEDFKPVSQITATSAPVCAQPANMDYGCATPGYEKPMTLDEAKAIGTGIVIFHYGKGIEDANIAAEVATRSGGIPTIAIPGGPDNKVQAILSGWSTDALIYTQSDMDRSAMTAQAMRLYPRILERQGIPKPVDVASLSGGPG